MECRKKTIALPLRSSAHPDLKQFSLVFHSETETLATGNYPISENGEAGTVSLAKAYFANAPFTSTVHSARRKSATKPAR